MARVKTPEGHVIILQALKSNAIEGHIEVVGQMLLIYGKNRKVPVRMKITTAIKKLLEDK